MVWLKRYAKLAMVAVVLAGIGGLVYALDERGAQGNDATGSPTASSPKQTATVENVPGSSEPSCSGVLTKAATEGPYYTAGSPAKTDFTVDDPEGEVITISGYVFDSSCKPVANAYLDLWHADSAGEYDNSGYKLRGHFETDENGRYSVRTVMAGLYPGRTEHWHIKVARDSSLSGALTTQLFPPGSESHEADNIYDASLLLKDFEQNEAKTERVASFDFVIR